MHFYTRQLSIGMENTHLFICHFRSQIFWCNSIPFWLVDFCHFSRGNPKVIRPVRRAAASALAKQCNPKALTLVSREAASAYHVIWCQWFTAKAVTKSPSTRKGCALACAQTTQTSMRYLSLAKFTMHIGDLKKDDLPDIWHHVEWGLSVSTQTARING